MTDDRHVRASERPDPKFTVYAGDGVYAAFDGYGIWLTAENGIEATDAIYLEPQVWHALSRFVEALRHAPAPESPDA